MMEIEEIIKCTNASRAVVSSDSEIQLISTDTRKITTVKGCLFIALTGPNFDGHDFLDTAFDLGVRNFLVSKPVEFPESNIIIVENTLLALQALCACHRKAISCPVIAITGSNGKTIIKDWVSQILGKDMAVCSSPMSYNSQVGVPLSVWNLNSNHQIGIFEAGVSRSGEMEKLEQIIQPTLGVFTNLGSAHDDGFTDRKAKLKEKLQLFKNTKKLIFRDTHNWVSDEIKTQFEASTLISWGEADSCEYTVQYAAKDHNVTITVNEIKFRTHFQEKSFLENLTHCIVTLLHLGYKHNAIQEGISTLEPVPMRLEIKNGRNNSLLIDDTYNNDITAISHALDFLKQQKKYKRKSLILSDVINGELNNPGFSHEIQKIIEAAGLDQVILVGSQFYMSRANYPERWYFERSTEELLKGLAKYDFSETVVLIKGARPYRFERIVFALQEKVHETHLEIDLNALVGNLNWFRHRLNDSTKLMVMVKASAYGSGSLEIASTLQYNRVDYFGVAYVDEGVALRQSGIQTPILVLNAPGASVDVLTQYDLEPEIYSISQLQDLIRSKSSSSKKTTEELRVHLNLETGMNRLGIEEHRLGEVTALLNAHRSHIKVQGIMSHLVGSDTPEHEDFTRLQAHKFEKASGYVIKQLDINPIRHLLNSSGIISYPEYQYDMARLGIGLYGLDSTGKSKGELTPVGTLTSIISQIKEIRAGDTIGYSRSGMAKNDMRIATIAIGYSDGFPRALSNGVGSVWIKGQEASVVGNVCMDMAMVDITDIDAVEGDPVTIFGNEFTIDRMADSLNTIPYEVLTGVSDRVKRLFVYK